MKNARQVNPIYRDLIKRHPNYKMTSMRFLCKTPVHHLACGIFVERSSDANCCWPRWSVTPLFVYRIFHYLALGTIYENLSRPDTSADRFWHWSDPTMVSDLIEAIETTAMPKLSYYETVESYATLPPETYGPLHEAPEDLMLVHIAMGELDAARTIWQEQDLWHRNLPGHPVPRQRWLREQLDAVAEPLHAGDRPALARILHGWEAANVQGTELERYWEPTPFPLEL